MFVEKRQSLMSGTCHPAQQGVPSPARVASAAPRTRLDAGAFALATAAVAAAVMGLAGCTQTAKQERGSQATMVHVAKQVQACWFAKSGPDPALKGYTMAPEVNSYTGKPRILIVPKNDPAGLPKLVAQAETSQGRTTFTTFGPLLATADGPRLDASLRAWSRGSKSC